MSAKGKIAKEFYTRPNTNCAQAALCAFFWEAGISEETAMKVASGFGGGVRDKEVCGAICGTIMALGLILGQKNEDDVDAKKQVSELTIELHKKFKEKHSSIVCRDLKEKNICAQLIYDSADILESLLKDQGIICPAVR